MTYNDIQWRARDDRKNKVISDWFPENEESLNDVVPPYCHCCVVIVNSYEVATQPAHGWRMAHVKKNAHITEMHM